jgi:hypothetical protein
VRSSAVRRAQGFLRGSCRPPMRTEQVEGLAGNPVLSQCGTRSFLPLGPRRNPSYKVLKKGTAERLKIRRKVRRFVAKSRAISSLPVSQPTGFDTAETWALRLSFSTLIQTVEIRLLLRSS